MELAMVYVTCPDAEVAQRLARALLDERLVACANWWTATSLYRYDGQVVNEPETVLVMKTRDELAQRVIDAVEELHPYETPCVIAYPAARASEAYAEWVAGETNG